MDKCKIILETIISNFEEIQEYLVLSKVKWNDVLKSHDSIFSDDLELEMYKFLREKIVEFLARKMLDVTVEDLMLYVDDYYINAKLKEML